MSNILCRGRFLLLATLILAVLLQSAAVAQNQKSGASEDEKAASESQASKEDNLPELLSKAESEGSVRVIVGLEAELPQGEFVPEGELSRPQATDQRESISTAQEQLLTDLGESGVQKVHKYETIPYVALELSPEALETLRSSPSVTSIVEDRPVPVAQDAPNDPVPPTLAESAPKTQADKMWAAGFTGSGQTVAVLDTGVDSSHSFLAGKVAEEACYASGAVKGNGVGYCPNGTESQTGSGSGVHCNYDAVNCGHGSHVAGISAGKGSSSSGVAKDAKVMAVQVFSNVLVDPNTGKTGARSYPSDQLKGLERVYSLRSTHNFSSVNMSLGGGQYFSNCDAEDPGLKAAIDNLKSAGIATVIASGNEDFKDSMASPGCISSAVSVGSTTKSDTIWSWPGTSPPVGSNSASFLSLLAPGSEIKSSVPGGEEKNLSGTSMATPHVAGAWALLKQRHPTASVDDLLTALKNTGTPVTDNRPGGGITKPRINIFDASTSMGGGNKDTTPPTGWISINNNAAKTKYATVTLNFSANDNAGGTGVKEMRFGNAGGAWSAWETYPTFSRSKLWTLAGGKGTRTVYAQFKDGAGNITMVSDSITRKGKKK